MNRIDRTSKENDYFESPSIFWFIIIVPAVTYVSVNEFNNPIVFLIYLIKIFYQKDFSLCTWFNTCRKFRIFWEIFGIHVHQSKNISYFHVNSVLIY